MFVIETIGSPNRRDEAHPKDLLRRATTSICPKALESRACSCLITGCAPLATEDLRKTTVIKETEYSYSISDIPVTYTNIEYSEIPTTTTVRYVETEVSGILSTHTTTVKCTPSVSNPSFFLQATNAPGINGKYYWAAPLSPRILSFSIEAAFTDNKEEATVFSLDSKKRLITSHRNGTLYANYDSFGDFELAHLMTRGEIQKRNYLYFRCEIRPPSGNYPGGYGELYCKADGFWGADIWNFCPLYVEYFNAGLIMGTEWSETSPDCYNVVFLVKPVCE
ncbi:hypothetical protein ABW20_dc0108035 [Dactylellina cionopaga]|nr:hypothetical protein ABW20_dc0108035 [Dactylellina cionopaga]